VTDAKTLALKIVREQVRALLLEDSSVIVDRAWRDAPSESLTMTGFSEWVSEVASEVEEIVDELLAMSPALVLAEER
jgi:hypothetical protein